MVLHIGRLRSGDIAAVTDDIAAVVAVAEGRIVKVILETAYLTDEQVVAGSKAAEAAGASFVKTSTGFAGGGATLHHLRLMRDAVSPAVRIKASGGVRGLDTLLEMRAIGVDRFGTSATETILTDVQRLVATGSRLRRDRQRLLLILRPILRCGGGSAAAARQSSATARISRAGRGPAARRPASARSGARRPVGDLAADPVRELDVDQVAVEVERLVEHVRLDLLRRHALERRVAADRDRRRVRDGRVERRSTSRPA